MRDPVAVASAEHGKLRAELERVAFSTERHTQWKRCRHCLGTIPPPRRRYCSDFCAEKGKLKLQAWRRKRTR